MRSRSIACAKRNNAGQPLLAKSARYPLDTRAATADFHRSNIFDVPINANGLARDILTSGGRKKKCHRGDIVALTMRRSEIFLGTLHASAQTRHRATRREPKSPGPSVRLQPLQAVSRSRECCSAEFDGKGLDQADDRPFGRRIRRAECIAKPPGHRRHGDDAGGSDVSLSMGTAFRRNRTGC